MLKKIWFQVHWFLGITAGVVLMLVGVTGAFLSYEDEIVALINPGIVTVPVRTDAVPLTPPELLERLRASQPDRAITAITVEPAPGHAARVTFAGRGPRGDTVHVDPYTAALLGKPRGEAGFMLVMQLHRWLAMGEVGKQIVAASTVALIVLSLSGLYLRWPRRPLHWRSWLQLDLGRRGRSLLWELHSVIGTWMLVLYVVMSLTGLWWSYGWYRDAINRMAGMPAQQQRGPGPGGGGGGAPVPAIDLTPAWLALQATAADFRRAQFRLPTGEGQPVRISYLAADAAHDRANDQLVVAPDGQVREHRVFREQPAGQRLVGSMFALHSGSYFGEVGKLLFMLSSLAMPLFGITGWILYLDRRRKRQAALALASATPATSAGVTDPLLVAFASQTATAERLAWQSAKALLAAGIPVDVQPVSALDGNAIAARRRALFVVSTFGEGEPPDDARRFRHDVMGAPAALDGLHYGLLALGDRSYEKFCGFGHELDGWLRRHGALPLFEPVELDRGDAAALDAWRRRVQLLGGDGTSLAWTEAPFHPWRLAARRELNPGSPGLPVFHLELEPRAGTPAGWQAGDIAEIEIPHPEDPARRLTRDYSIASLASDGHLDLLVRQVRHADGRPGPGSAWLTAGVATGGTIQLRLRDNPGFHPQPDARPLLLIGNGTGIAGLRAHLRHQAKLGRRRNWLVMGERTRAHDGHYRQEIEDWQRTGVLDRVDLAFSRDQPERIYVQDRLNAEGAQVRAFVEAGAAIYVCGSLDGMAPGVHAVLDAILGAGRLDELAAAGRYRRDVY